ncbi:MAG: MFS transporter, partial [Oscillospiraceae bacterium]|nr:MFS transporter [Oscillospiraceae bacterium]
MKTQNKQRPFGLRDKLAYAAGDLGCNMSFGLKGTVQTFWLVYMMMETGLFSILLLLVQIWDAINDPIIGSMIDRDKRQYKHGKYKQYIFIGACGLLIGGAAVFLPFPNAGTVLKAVLFIFGYVIWDAAYTMANVPYGTMLNLVSEKAEERASLSVFRSIGGAVGGMLPGIILPMLIWQKVTFDPENPAWFLDKIEIPAGAEGKFVAENFLSNPVTGEAYAVGDKVLSPLTGSQIEVLLGEKVFWAALIMGVIGFVFFMLMIKHITIRGNEYAELNDQGEKVNFFKSFGTFMKNRPAVGCTIAVM